MKNFILLSLLVLTFASCSKDVLDVEFSTTLSQTSDEISVNETASRVAGGSFSTEFVLDLSNQDTQPYLNKIKEITLQDVVLTFQGLEALAGNQTATNLTITFDDQIVIELNDFVFGNVAAGQDFILNESAKINEAAGLLLQNKKLNVKVEGVIPDSAVYHFFITLNTTAKITANPL